MSFTGKPLRPSRLSYRPLVYIWLNRGVKITGLGSHLSSGFSASGFRSLVDEAPAYNKYCLSKGT